MKLRVSIKTFFCLIILSLSHFVQAGSVSINSYASAQNPGGFAQSVVGSWGFSDRITFTESGSYSLQLTDFGSSESFNSFDYLGAFITSTSEKVASFTFSNGAASSEGPVIFDIDQGEYWLNVLAVADSTFDLGLLGVNVTEYTAVPLPPAFMFMLSALLGLVAYGRKKMSKS